MVTRYTEKIQGPNLVNSSGYNAFMAFAEVMNLAQYTVQVSCKVSIDRAKSSWLRDQLRILGSTEVVFCNNGQALVCFQPGIRDLVAFHAQSALVVAEIYRQIQLGETFYVPHEVHQQDGHFGVNVELPYDQSVRWHFNPGQLATARAETDSLMYYLRWQLKQLGWECISWTHIGETPFVCLGRHT